jgi:hypothetical protein
MSLARLVLVAMLFALGLAGCQKKPPAAPPSLPQMNRPVFSLQVKPAELLRIRIPRQALVERGGVPGVFVLSPAGEARFRMVRSGGTLGAQVEILSGLHGDETLVLGDLAEVHDGSPIEAVFSR